MAEPMTTDEALKIVLELAEQNMLEENGIDTIMNGLQDEAKRQTNAVAIVRVVFRIV